LQSVFWLKNQNLSFKVDIKEREDGDWISFGQLTEGKLEGWGIDVNLNGSVLEIGTFKDGILEGEGLCACSDGDQYIGHFKHGLNDGFGKKTWADGKSYEGEWRKGMRHGKGKMVWPKGGYEWFGEWENDTPQDEVGCLHVGLRECIQRDICTSALTGETKNYGQFLYWCTACEIWLCCVCKNNCHVGGAQGLHLFMKKQWYGHYCGCIKKDKSSNCKRKGELEQPYKKIKFSND